MTIDRLAPHRHRPSTQYQRWSCFFQWAGSHFPWPRPGANPRPGTPPEAVPSPPPALDPVPAVVVFLPVARLPLPVAALERDPASRHPPEVAPAPLPVAPNPDVRRSGPWPDDLHAWRRWAPLDVAPAPGRGRPAGGQRREGEPRQPDPGAGCEEAARHGSSSLRGR